MATNLNLQLETNEAHALHGALQSYLSETQLELMRTDNSDFRKQLHQEIALLSRVETKLDQVLGPKLDQAA